jgi:CpXC protein
VDCPACGQRRSAMVVDLMTPMEAEQLSGRVRDLGTVTCPKCGHWTYHPPRISGDRSTGPVS